MVKFAKQGFALLTQCANALFGRLRQSQHKRLILVFSALYFGGYANCRSSHLMVHALGYGVGDEGRFVLQHRVKRGDFGVPIFNLPLNLLVELSYWAYLPIRQLETLGWYILQPRRSILPHTERSLDDLRHQKEKQKLFDALNKVRESFSKERKK